MKKIINYLIIFAAIFLVPSIGHALTGTPTINCNTTTLVKGGTTTCTIGVNTKTTAISGTVSASGGLSIVSTKITNGWQGNNSSNIDVYSNSAISGAVATVTVKMGTSNGTLTFKVSTVGDPSFNSTTLSTTTATKSFTYKVVSKNNNLASMSVSGCNLQPAFSPSTLSYKCADTDSGSVSITAKADDSKAKVSGAGNRKLNYGANTLNVVVTAESGAKKTYSISIKRNDNRNDENHLSALSIEGYKIDFKPDVTTYNLTVANDVTKIKINATPKDPKGSVQGVGYHNLKVGTNVINVVSLAENTSRRVYVVKVIRSEQENIPSTDLLAVKIGTRVVDVSEVTGNTFLIGQVNMKNVNVTGKTSSKTTSYTVQGDGAIKSGINKILITAKDTGCEDKTYTVLLYNIPEEYERVTSLETADFSNSIVFNNTEYSKKAITKEVFKAIEGANSKLLYNVMYDNWGLYYSLEFSKDSILDNNLDIRLLVSNDDPYSYVSNIPNGVNINLYLGNKFEDGNIKLYSYDMKSGKYTLITDSLSVENGYASFKSDGSSNYVFSKEEINNKDELKDDKNLLYSCIFGFAVGTILTLIIALIISSIKGKSKKTKKAS